MTALRYIVNIRKWLFDWWPFISITVWGLLFCGMVAFGNIMYDLSDAIGRLAGSLSASKSYQLYLKEQINATNRDVKENQIHIQAQSQRLDIIQERLNQLIPEKDKNGNRISKEARERGLIIREYVLMPKEGAKDTAEVNPPSNE